ncbi:MAG: RIP metalloprotease RseP [Methanomicrobia archaeon]|nr:RIP metalloprotease RseP [Methanomicrobia archaeon]
MFLTIVIFILVLSVLVFAHELGHFFTARSLGVKAEEFGFGFPPRALGFYRNEKKRWRLVMGNRSVESLENSSEASIRPAAKATVYSLNYLPLGGFVKIKGENGEGKNDQDSFAAKKIWERMVILSAGVIMNVILAWFLFSLGYLIGLPQTTDTLGKKAIVSESSVQIAEVMPESPASFAGLMPGDIFLKVEGEAVDSEPELQALIGARDSQVTTLTILRGDKEETILVTPTVTTSNRATMGVAIFSAGLVRYPFFPALIEGAKTTGWMIKEIVLAFGGLLGDLFSGEKVGDQFAGPVGIASITGQAARLGFTYLLQFMALLSLNLAVINILPLPALDGGRILFLFIEKLKGKPVKREVEALIHNLGFFLLIALIIFITYKDIIKLF